MLPSYTIQTQDGRLYTRLDYRGDVVEVSGGYDIRSDSYHAHAYAIIHDRKWKIDFSPVDYASLKEAFEAGLAAAMHWVDTQGSGLRK